MIQRLAKSFRIRLLGFGLQFCLSKRFVCCIMQTYEGGSELLDHFNKASVASIVTFLLCWVELFGFDMKKQNFDINNIKANKP